MSKLWRESYDSRNHHVNRQLLHELIGQLKEMPMPNESICGVYFLMYHKRVVYVGASADIEQRIRSHWKTTEREDGKMFDQVRYVERDSMEDALILEAALIESFRPPLNKAGNTFKKMASGV